MRLRAVVVFCGALLMGAVTGLYLFRLFRETRMAMNMGPYLGADFVGHLTDLPAQRFRLDKERFLEVYDLKTNGPVLVMRSTEASIEWTRVLVAQEPTVYGGTNSIAVTDLHLERIRRYDGGWEIYATAKREDGLATKVSIYLDADFSFRCFTLDS